MATRHDFIVVIILEIWVQMEVKATNKIECLFSIIINSNIIA